MNTTIPDGGPAFPVTKIDGDGCTQVIKEGMSLRDWFTGMALQGWITRGAINNDSDMARLAYDSADAMLEVRGR